MNIFVSSLSFRAKKEDLIELFSPFGEVLSARIILNKETRRSRGYGFVEMASQEDGQAAIAALNGSEHMGRTINVAVAHDRQAPTQTPIVVAASEAEQKPADEATSDSDSVPADEAVPAKQPDN
ncbi:MAG: hypothetical protein WBK97_01540 [Bacteroidales bacterium]|jgi:RNA recognition motif-containing protein